MEPSPAVAVLRAATSAMRTALAIAVITAVAGSGCALLIPPSWRGRAPVPIAGPIGDDVLAGDASEGDDLPALDDAALRARIEADRQRLVELASAPERGPLESADAEAELREIADRLPRLQNELARRGSDPARGAPPSVIR